MKCISKFPPSLTTTAGLKDTTTKEAKLLSCATKVSERAVEHVMASLPDPEVEASVVLSKLTPVGLRALALATALFLAKYDHTSPTYRTSWSSLYACESRSCLFG